MCQPLSWGNAKVMKAQFLPTKESKARERDKDVNNRGKGR